MRHILILGFLETRKARHKSNAIRGRQKNLFLFTAEQQLEKIQMESFEIYKRNKNSGILSLKLCTIEVRNGKDKAVSDSKIKNSFHESSNIVKPFKQTMQKNLK